MHVERHQLYLQWAEAVQNSTMRDKLLSEVGKKFADHKQYLKDKESELEENVKALQRERDNNKDQEQELQMQERQI